MSNAIIPTDINDLVNALVTAGYEVGTPKKGFDNYWFISINGKVYDIWVSKYNINIKAEIPPHTGAPLKEIMAILVNMFDYPILISTGAGIGTPVIVFWGDPQRYINSHPQDEYNHYEPGSEKYRDYMNKWGVEYE